MNDEQYFLANAYLDGELTAEEQRVAASDPEVMAEVDRLRALQAELRDVAPPSDAARDAAVAAAMAEFAPADRATESPTPSVVPFRPRPSYAKYLGVAAAVVLVAGLGIIVSQAQLGGDDDDAGDDAAADVAVPADGALTEGIAEAPADDLADSELAVTAADDGGDGGSDAGGADAADEAAADDAGGDDAASDEDRMEEAAEETAEAAVAADADAGTAPTEPVAAQRWIVGLDFDPDDPITDQRELGIYGVDLIDRRAANRLPPSPNTSCGVDDEILDTATLELDGERNRVFVSVIEPDGLVFARDVDTCQVLLTGSIFVN